MKRSGRKPRTPIAERPRWAQQLIKHRQSAGLSQQALATLIGASQSTVADYETGDVRPSVAQTIKLATTLGIIASELLEEDELQDRSDEVIASDTDPQSSFKSQGPYHKFLCNSAFEVYRRNGLEVQPIYFALVCMSMWEYVMALSSVDDIAERIELVINQHELMVQRFAEDFRSAGVPGGRLPGVRLADK